MNKIISFSLLLLLITGCSFNQSSKFWTKTEIIQEENKTNIEKIFVEEEALSQEFNPDLKIDLKIDSVKNNFNKDYNNPGTSYFDNDLKDISKYKFSKIDNFEQYEPEILFHQNNLIFFDNKGSILKFNEKKNLIWKKNYYSKSEKKFKPILQFASNENFLVVADNIAKIYKVDLNTGELIWSTSNDAPFNSQIKIFKDKFFIIDFSNTLRCYSLEDGSELWSVNTQNTLIRSKKNFL